MYSGAGCAGITNWARALLAIKPETENMEVFKFIAAKRGKRIDDWNGEFERYFAWSSRPNSWALRIARRPTLKGRPTMNCDGSLIRSTPT